MDRFRDYFSWNVIWKHEGMSGNVGALVATRGSTLSGFNTVPA